MHISAHTTLMAQSEEELNSFLIMVEEVSEKTGLKLNIHKTKIMASYPITSWQIDGENVETVTDFIFLDFKIIAGGDFGHEIKRCLLLGRSYDKPRQHIKKQRHHFTDKGPCIADPVPDANCLVVSVCAHCSLNPR